LLVRVLLVLGGALVVTGIGWLVSSASASADVLPGVPVTPTAVVSSVTDAISARTLPTPALPTPALPTPALRTPSLPSAPADLGQVTQQVHLAVSGVRDRVAPVTTPAADLVPLAETATGPTGGSVTVTAPVAVPTVLAPVVRSITVVAHRHAVIGSVEPRPSGSTPTSVPARHLPALPPVQPGSSSDATAHGSGGFAGGAGGTQNPFVTVLGAASHTIGLPITPRLPVGPGQQPGTSPD
jgi:hypothetical protein